MRLELTVILGQLLLTSPCSLENGYVWPLEQTLIGNMEVLLNGSLENGSSLCNSGHSFHSLKMAPVYAIQAIHFLH